MSARQGEQFMHNGAALAFARTPGAAPTFVWLSGFKSDMGGTKAESFAQWAKTRGQSFLRFDYSGHGASEGRFEDGTISRWLGDALAVIDAQSAGPLVLVGSSMGGWLALLAARARTERVKGLLLIAPAADFTDRLMWATFDEETRHAILKHGRWERPSAYDPEPHVITRALIEDGRAHRIMDAPFPFAGPVWIVHGGRDVDVPAGHVRALADLIESPNLRVTYVEDGDHRLSRAQDLALLTRQADALADQLSVP